MISVTKVDGMKQLFDRQKILRTCLRMGASRETAERVSRKIEANIFEGISTEQILQMIRMEMDAYRAGVRHFSDLWQALGQMNPKPDFELFVQGLLR